MGNPVTDSMLPNMVHMVSPTIDDDKLRLRQEIKALKVKRQEDERTLHQLRSQMTQFYLRNESLLRRKDESDAQLHKELRRAQREIQQLKKENEEFRQKIVFHVCQEKQLIRENEAMLFQTKALEERLQHCTGDNQVHFDYDNESDDPRQVEQKVHAALRQCQHLIAENSLLEDRYQRTVQAAVQKCDQLRTKNRALEKRLKHCRCLPPNQQPGSRQAAVNQTSKKERKSKSQPTTQAELPPQQPSAPTSSRKSKSKPLAALEHPTDDPRYIAFSHIDSQQEHWEEELAAHPPPTTKHLSTKKTKKKQLVQQLVEEDSSSSEEDGASSEEEDAGPAPQVNTKTRGFYIQESPAEAWRRRKEAQAQKQEAGKAKKSQKDPVEKRIQKNKALAVQTQGNDEFLAKFKKMGLGGAEHVVEASGAVQTSDGVMVTKLGVTYRGQTAIEKEQEAKKAREEAEWKEHQEEETRKRKVERALRGGKPSDDESEESY